MTTACPKAVQIADRWHLLRSLSRAVEQACHQHRGCLRKHADRGRDQPVHMPLLRRLRRKHLRRRRAEEPAVAVTRLRKEMPELGYTGFANLLVRCFNQGRAEGNRPVTTPRHASGLPFTNPKTCTRRKYLCWTRSRRPDRRRPHSPISYVASLPC